MFNLFRSQKQIVKILLGAILSLVAVSMVITMIPGSWGAAANANQNLLAEVGDPTLWWLANTHTLTILDVQQAMPNTPNGPHAGLALETIDQELTKLVLMREAEELGLESNEQELADWLKVQMPFFFIDGVFQPDRYRVLIAQRFRTSIPRFEEEVRRSLMIDVKLRRMVVDTVEVDEEDIIELYRRANEKTRLRFVKIRANDFERQLAPNEEALREFYEERKQQYSVPESRDIKLMTVDATDLPAITVSEKEIARQHRQNRQRYQVDERIRASHILFMTEGKSDEEKKTLKEKAEFVKKDLQQGMDFATLAKEHSDDPGTAEKGGDLGWVTRGQMVPSFEKASFALTSGKISDVISTEYGYHIIKVHEKQGAHLQSLDEVRETIKQELIEERQYNTRMQRIDNAIASARQAGKDFESVAASLDLGVKILAKVGRNDSPAILSEFETLTASLFAANDGEIVTATQNDRTAIAVVTTITPERPAEFQEARKRVRTQYIARESKRLAEERANEVGTAATKEDLRKAARRFQLKTELSNFLRRQDSLPNLGAIGLLGDKAFTSVTGKSVGPVLSNDAWVIYEVIGHQEAEMEHFLDDRDEMSEKHKEMLQEQEFDLYRRETQRRFEEAGRVRRYHSNIQRYVSTFSGRR